MTSMREKESAFIVSLGTQLIMPEMRLLSNANLLSKQSMDERGKGKSCPHFGMFGKTRGSNKSPQHKVEAQLIFLCWEVGLILGRSRGPDGRLSLSLPFSASHKSDNYLFRLRPDSLSTASEEEPQRVNESESVSESGRFRGCNKLKRN